MTAELVKREESVPTENPIVSMIERVATDPNMSIEKLERMLDMQERILARDAKAEHAAAKAEAMAEMPSVPMSGIGHNKRPYSTLKDITSTTRPVLARHGLSLTFDVRIDGGQIVVTAILTHRNGHDERVSLPLPADNSGSKNAVQGIGSSQTYGQRYTAQAILGLSLGEDVEDDGRAGGAGETISAEQFRELREMMDKASADEGKFLNYLRVDALQDLHAEHFKTAKAALQAKIDAKGAQ